jgi:hypothetical protein
MDDHEDKQIPTIFHDILVSKLPPAEKKLDRIYQEGQTFDDSLQQGQRLQPGP